MLARDFVYWLNGYIELAEPKEMTATQVACVKRHLSLVFLHDIDPNAGGPEVQVKLNEAHSSSEGLPAPKATLPPVPDPGSPYQPAKTHMLYPGGPLIRC